MQMHIGYNLFKFTSYGYHNFHTFLQIDEVIWLE